MALKVIFNPWWPNELRPSFKETGKSDMLKLLRPILTATSKLRNTLPQQQNLAKWIWAIYYKSLTYFKDILGRIPLLNYLIA